VTNVMPSVDAELAAQVRAGLQDPVQKRLPARLFYDDIGSALFDVISLLPEYGLTRADERILRRHAAEIVAALPPIHSVAELGSGSGRKTRWILEALAPGAPRAYYPIDISRSALARCVHELADVPDVLLSPIEADYLGGLALATSHRPGPAPLLVLFLGSTIGNFDRPDGERFLAQVRAILSPGDALLLGTDLVKPEPQLLAAYDDALGVTAAFNLNTLAHLNRALGASFDLAGFDHQARWDAQARRIEMHLRARRAQTVHLGALGLDVVFRESETIWTESSHKYDADEPRAIAARTGFHCTGQWLDDEWRFAETLLIAR
jgi:dimethylhistidine N-methyltransferase